MINKSASWKLVNTFFFSFILIFFVNCSENELVVNDDSQAKKSGIQAVDSLSFQAGNSFSNQVETETQLLLFVGTYSSSIFIYKVDTLTGAISKFATSPSTSSPSYLAFHPNHKWIFVVNETGNGNISSFGFDSLTNKITFINSVSAKGDAPCYISIDKSGKYVMAANYNSGSVTVCPINADGSLGQATSTDQHTGKGTVAGRQDGPHAHMIMQADNKFVYNTDLGINKIIIYTLDTLTGKIQNAGVDANAETGAGPRHIAFHPTQPWAYVVAELSGIVEAFTVDNATGALTHFQSISTLPAGVTKAAASADIHITPNGKFLYASNRGSNNNIAAYSIDQTTGNLTLIGHKATGGNTPRSFAIDPTGTFLLVANQDASNVVSFKIDQATGELIETGLKSTISSPVCLKFCKMKVAVPNTTGIRTIEYKH